MKERKTAALVAAVLAALVGVVGYGPSLLPFAADGAMYRCADFSQGQSPEYGIEWQTFPHRPGWICETGGKTRYIGWFVLNL